MKIKNNDDVDMKKYYNNEDINNESVDEILNYVITRLKNLNIKICEVRAMSNEIMKMTDGNKNHDDIVIRELNKTIKEIAEMATQIYLSTPINERAIDTSNIDISDYWSDENEK